MNALRLLLAGVMVGALAVGVRAETKQEKKPDNATLILGTWEATKADEGTMKVGTVIEFIKDGKMKVVEEGKTIEAAYKVEGDQLTFIVTRMGQERKRTLTIKKLTEKELFLVGDGSKGVELARKK